MEHDRMKWEVQHGPGCTIRYRPTTIFVPHSGFTMRALEMDLNYTGPQSGSAVNILPYQLRTENWDGWFERTLTHSAAEIWLIRGTLTANPEIMCFLTMVYSRLCLKPESYLRGLARFNKHIETYTIQAWSGKPLFGPHDKVMPLDEPEESVVEDALTVKLPKPLRFSVEVMGMDTFRTCKYERSCILQFKDYAAALEWLRLFVVRLFQHNSRLAGSNSQEFLDFVTFPDPSQFTLLARFELLSDFIAAEKALQVCNIPV